MKIDQSRVREFVARYCDADQASVRLVMDPLRGGLRSSAVVRVRAEFSDRSGQPHRWSFVAKRLDGIDRREASIYQDLLGSVGWDGAPRLLGVEPAGPEASCLYMEYVVRSQPWPWTNSNVSAMTLEQLARLHTAAAPALLDGVSPAWSYEDELLATAHMTQQMYEQVTIHEELAGLRQYRTALGRVVKALSALRTRLLHSGPFPVCVIHGDAHPGNALIRTRSGRESPVLLDWGRARAGSPLEDVASWLQSLGYWEPEARRRHDTLFRRYLEARAVPNELTRNLRDHYWLAGMCNILSGSLRYHLWIAGGWDEAPSRARAESLRAARDQLRVIRRADILWRELTAG